MRAAAIREFKAPIEILDLPKPEPGPGEILVHLRAAGVNPMDWQMVDGALAQMFPHEFPLVPGLDGAGTVEALGPGATRFAVGDGVYGQFFKTPARSGTFAEYVVGPEAGGVAMTPRGMYDAQAAAIPTAGMTALTTLDQLGLQKGQSLLIFGAAGGVGSFLVQLASNEGIHAMAATRVANRDYLHKLGAYRVFDAVTQSFPDDVRMAFPDGVDVMLDLWHNAAEMEPYLALLKRGGTIASTHGSVPAASAEKAGLRTANINLQPKPELLDRLGKEFSSGRLRIPLEEKVPLVEAGSVLDRGRSGGLRGKTVLLL